MRDYQHQRSWKDQPGPPPSVLFTAISVLVVLGWMNFKNFDSMTNYDVDVGQRQEHTIRRGWPAVSQIHIGHTIVYDQWHRPRKSKTPEVWQWTSVYSFPAMALNVAFALSTCIAFLIPVNAIMRGKLTDQHGTLLVASLFIAVACFFLPNILTISAQV